IAKSLEIDLRDRTVARGGSTISQQLVKNAFLTQRRTLDRKLQEAILTWRLEARLDKATILERYLNVIELGPHVFGIGAAAKYWFDEPASALTVHQAAFLAALTSEPRSMSHRVRRAGGLDTDSKKRVDVILHAMGMLDDSPMGFAKSALRDE
ncbi:MAG TPA: biosynthetic peptidoglycan transglycosylase, partial [Kofleriaceae bacterium]